MAFTGLLLLPITGVSGSQENQRDSSMQHGFKLGRWGFALLPLLGCGGGDSHPAPSADLDLDRNGPPSSLHQTAVDECSTPETGCPCDEEGVELDCGTVSEHRGDYVICRPGTRTCSGGVWGECTASTAIEDATTLDSN